MRRECDDRAGPGQFILTGSASPQDDITRHTGVARIGRVLMRLRAKVARSRTDELAGLLVVTSAGAAYRRPDGVQVAPITALGP